jgi:hypothetical protein
MNQNPAVRVGVCLSAAMIKDLEHVPTRLGVDLLKKT